MDDKEYWRNEKVAFLSLTLLKGIGFWTLYKLSQSKRGFKESLKNPAEAGIAKFFVDQDGAAVHHEKLWASGLALARNLSKQNISLLFKAEKDFPCKLAEIPDPPEWIFVQGHLENLNAKSVAIVGTRKCSEDGIFLTKLTVASLYRSGLITISGLAHGIDQCAHRESIRYSLPTVAVIGTGILNDYPKGCEPLRAEILSHGGTIVSEYLPSQSYSAENFVRRNRLQAGLCDVLLPVEWGIKSGTAHTVKNSHKYGKKIISAYLPNTLEAREEVIFAVREYEAIPLELPCAPEILITMIDPSLCNETSLNISDKVSEQPYIADYSEGADIEPAVMIENSDPIQLDLL